jgi:phosphatidylserine/phosphatidylglycerophosphate/cardiolipin synthase-like enzyme
VERLTYVLANLEEENQDEWADSKWVQVAIGKRGGPESLDRWAQEHLSGLNEHALYVHTKILLIDPLSDDPTVVTGTANFSDNSTDENDENMLVIRGDPEVADIYFTEFNRIFNHLYARYWAYKLSQGETAADDTTSFLAETPSWLSPYFADWSPKSLRRVLLAEQVDGNT